MSNRQGIHFHADGRVFANGTVFHPLREDYWRTEDGRFELTNQPFEGEDDWGVWDTVRDEWTHVAESTGFDTKTEAVAAFIRSQS
ncbi:hypothetical protein MYRNA_108 [Mycobacterium phage Myrna]|uniref:Uncharacterized protein n=1 Tax=Mycobacterium phage Myrna TaxID=546805 RepID=B5LJB2_9CAUD|nr:gp108 [Mycobacterium phage Myrna]ACH62109.1 hypothetical protein MYRNA_108 [Mycobacterium phage Myrna]